MTKHAKQPESTVHVTKSPPAITSPGHPEAESVPLAAPAVVVSTPLQFYADRGQTTPQAALVTYAAPDGTVNVAVYGAGGTYVTTSQHNGVPVAASLDAAPAAGAFCIVPGGG
jgi:hypothetical protein